MAQILDGRAVSDSLLAEVQRDVEELKQKGVFPKLVVIFVGENAASQVYVRKKQEACEKVGMLSEKLELPASISQDALIAEIERLNHDPEVHGMILQLPIPKHLEVSKIIKAIDPVKDVDGFQAYNVGKMFLSAEFENMAPCTPKGITKILEFYKIDVSGMNIVVIGRSNIVGKPMGVMLLNRDATVTICHSKTKDLEKFTREADLLVAAVGKPRFVKADMVKEGAIVIDVGMHRTEDGKLCGDVDFETVEPKVSMITPVPGGVGPMTVACLLMNTVTAARKQVTL
ncbi:bifunctional methylenetetrahydrofolate dehydrogenase/methenyltetrahydrofolate cyclohydrolase FolD [Candidatus Peregrinibacteria bacterium]|nr:MAG: bifunctional methylenetetrahydrofolate dehydrogenase/methenyltetrahydrofolate cyclohydrolase FolD [Candidatus Peregrinibacteria bacterium]